MRTLKSLLAPALLALFPLLIDPAAGLAMFAVAYAVSDYHP